ncbi:hypothetical protein PGT21_014845 [Puccinia graminis f. sp. tritici]|uniref:Uncharacterized protein n=1 Tax=Puccinia graminis f. sp. tritici TaxID=56615 RepID=A0A5B0MR43_PUCGR|nr:hypothetical protein PGT21_014845 [Puccinia graminis f. sp. tritici]
MLDSSSDWNNFSTSTLQELYFKIIYENMRNTSDMEQSGPILFDDVLKSLRSKYIYHSDSDSDSCTEISRR